MHFKVISFGDITDDVSDDFGTEGYALVTKGSVRFWTKITIFLKSWSRICADMRKMREIRVAMYRIKVET